MAPHNPNTATAPASSTSSIQQSASNSKPHPPTHILSSPLAQTYSLIHPFLILSVFALRFSSLVADPTTALLQQLPVLAGLQLVYAVLCLPPAGAGSSKSHGGSSGGASRGGKKRSDGGGIRGRDGTSGKIFTALLTLPLLSLLGTPLLSSVLILFGAPVTTHLPHTILCATHIAVLAGTSLIYVHGTDSSAWNEIWGASRVLDSVWAGAVGAGLGAWLGAVPIPLDWDRPWQAYPITIVTGAYVGYALGCAMGRTPLLYGKRIQFDASEATEPEMLEGETQTEPSETDASALTEKMKKYAELL